MVARGTVRFFADDIWDTPDDGNRYEVINGALYVTPPPNYGHQNAVGELYGRLWQHIRARNLGKIVTSPVGVVLDEGSGVQPDIVFVSTERLHIISERGIEGAPDLVVEVLSPSTRHRDRGVKLRRYAAAKVPHYWMLDPRSRSLEARQLGPDGYEPPTIHGPGSVFEPELFPGLTIPIDELWR